MKKNDAVNLILDELERASNKFPQFPTDPVHAAGVVGEESGELLQAALEFTYENGPMQQLITEAIQTGAMAIRFLMTIEAMEARESDQAYPACSKAFTCNGCQYLAGTLTEQDFIAYCKDNKWQNGRIIAIGLPIIKPATCSRNNFNFKHG